MQLLAGDYLPRHKALHHHHHLWVNNTQTHRQGSVSLFRGVSFTFGVSWSHRLDTIYGGSYWSLRSVDNKLLS